MQVLRRLCVGESDADGLKHDLGRTVVGDAFEVVLAKTGATVIVEEGTTVLAAVIEVLPDLAFSCEEGYCGDCQVGVLEGEPDHRDDYLQPHEQERCDLMMICVSRCKGNRLVLDL